MRGLMVGDTAVWDRRAPCTLMLLHPAPCIQLPSPSTTPALLVLAHNASQKIKTEGLKRVFCTQAVGFPAIDMAMISGWPWTDPCVQF